MNGRYKVKPEPTKNKELLELADNYKEFNETDIESRSKLIMDSFIKYLKSNSLLS